MKWPLFLVLLFIVIEQSPAQDVRSRLKGLVFESEDWSEPKSAWVKDERRPDKWCLWTTEGKGKRSGDQSLVSPRIEKDRSSPEEGAPPLHMHITGIPKGTYIAYLGNTTRPIAVSLDGKTWEKTEARGETWLGFFEIKDGAFDLWVDDRYANPPNIGSCYFDYVRLEPAEALKFHDLHAFTLHDGTTQLSWHTTVPVPGGTVEYGEGNFQHTAPTVGVGMLRNHRAFLKNLVAGKKYQALVRIKWAGHLSAESPPIPFIAGQRPIPAASRPTKIRLSVAEPTLAFRKQWPVTSGVPLPQGTLSKTENACVVHTAGAVMPAQFEAFSYWPDGSIKWLVVSFLADSNPGVLTCYDLEISSAPKPRLATDLKVEETTEAVVLSNSRLRMKLSRKSFALYDDLRIDQNGDGVFAEEERISGAPESGNLRIVSADNTTYGLGAPDKIVIEEKGPIRAVVRIEGPFVANEKTLFRYRLRIFFYAQQPFLGLNATIGNDRIETPLTPIRAAGMRLPITTQSEITAPPLRGSIDGRPFIDIKGPNDLWLLQDYDNRYTLSSEEKTLNGDHALGIAQVKYNNLVVSAVVKDFWQTYPKGLAIKPDGIHIRLLPPLPKEQYTTAEDTKYFISLFYWCRDGHYQFKRGLEYSADVFVRVDHADTAPPANVIAGHFQNPLFAAAEPNTYCESGVFGPIDPQVPGEFDDYSSMFERSFQALDDTRQKRREYGWMNFGDWFGERKYNWGNNEYDLAWCMALQFARTGNLKYLRRGEEMTRHYTTIDTVHYLPEPTWPGIVYMHCAGHVGGFFEHRDPRFKPEEWKHWYGQAFLSGGIDAGGHIYQTGNFIYGFLMGDRRYLEVAERVVSQQAQYLTRNFDFTIERAAGWSLINALSAYQATENPFYLNAARIYLEKILEKQDIVTGGWKMPQGQGECDCPDAGKDSHIGGKAFATGILLHGLILYDQICPCPEVKQSIVRAADWLMNHSWNKERHGFRYKTGCPKYQKDAGIGGTAALVSEGIAYAYELTKDTKYKDFLLSWLGHVMSYTMREGKSFAMHMRQTPFTLHYVKSWGIRQLPPPAPLKGKK